MAQKIFNLSGLALFIVAICILSFGIKTTKAYDPDLLVTTTTTNATPANIFSMGLATGKTMVITADMVAISGTNRYRARKTTMVANDAGTLRIVGGTVFDVITPVNDAGLATVGYNISTSGTNVIIPVTGASSTTIVWDGVITYRIY